MGGSIPPSIISRIRKKGVDTMWRVDWCGSFSEFSNIFSTKEEAVKFYNSLVTSKKKIYKAF